MCTSISGAVSSDTVASLGGRAERLRRNRLHVRSRPAGDQTELFPSARSHPRDRNPPTSLKPSPLVLSSNLSLPWLSHYSIQRQPPFSALTTFLELHFKKNYKNKQKKKQPTSKRGHEGRSRSSYFSASLGLLDHFDAR